MSLRVRVEGIVQGVGFRPYIYILAKEHGLCGWVLNDALGVEMQLEGSKEQIENFLADLPLKAPPAARLDRVSKLDSEPSGLTDFRIIASRQAEGSITTRISPDLAVCSACLNDLFAKEDPHFQYPYVNCTHCGPRYSIIKSLPYDRSATTMAPWNMCDRCRDGYENPRDRRFHAQPVACPDCGPNYFLHFASQENEKPLRGMAAISELAKQLRQGKIAAVKGIGGYHLVADAANEDTLMELRRRKYRKDKPFALMVETLSTAEALVTLNETSKRLLSGQDRPIVLAPADKQNNLAMALIAPDNKDLGIMLPYTPLHHLLFACGAPPVMVFTSANVSSEPIAYEDEQALEELGGIADLFLIGERPIQRRMDDSVKAVSKAGVHVIRRARGLAPDTVATLPAHQPILALGADLKNTITLVIAGQAFVSQYIGDLDHAGCRRAFEETISDLCTMYDVKKEDLLVVSDKHPQYVSTRLAPSISSSHRTVQHHQAHVASVLAERGMFAEQVIGIAFDGTGWGDDQAIWGGEFFVGSIEGGFIRRASLNYAGLPGGDAAAKFPPQSLAGFLVSAGALELAEELETLFPKRFKQASQMAQKNIRTWPTSSVGRLFDAAAALAGFDREISFEAQAAVWLEHQARSSSSDKVYSFNIDAAAGTLDWRDALLNMARDRLAGQPINEMARAFHIGLAEATVAMAETLCAEQKTSYVAISGGVMQNMLLLDTIHDLMLARGLQPMWNEMVPANDGGLSLGQAAIACFTVT